MLTVVLKRRGIALVGLALGAVLAALAVTGVPWDLDNGAPAGAEFPPRPFTTDDFWPDEEGVLHVRFAEGDARAEMWFDPRRGRARIEYKGDDGNLLVAAGVDGDVYWEYDASYPFLEIVKRTPDEIWNRWVAQHGWYVAFHVWLREGIIDSSDSMRNGQPVIEVRVPVAGETGTLDESRTFELDPETEPPYGSVGEWLAADRVEPTLFSIPQELPPLRSMDRDIQLTLEEARGFEDFHIYYLGSSVLGHPLITLNEFEKVYGADWSDPEEWPPSRYVQAIYGVPAGPGQPQVSALRITSWPESFVKAPWEEDTPMPRPGSPGREVTVAGVTGILFEAADETNLWFQLGDTVIQISGEDTEQVLSAAISVEKLN